MSMNAVENWFRRRRVGLFLHFGLYAIDGWHEQDQMRRRIPRATYGKLAERFNPVGFDADRILDLAAEVGMEYVCLTTKHHDGFCLWETHTTAFTVMRTPYGKDLVGELADACHRRNMPLGLYYSVADWHHPNYPNQGRHHELPGPEPGDRPDWNAYMDYLQRQVRELCTHYGPIRHFFWDMNVPGVQDPSVNAMIRSLQPDVVINDRGFDPGDFGTPEREYNQDETGPLVRFARPTEACNSIGTQSWGYRADEDYYSVPFLIQRMDAMMARGAHYLLNVGPDAQGHIPDRARDILRDIGAWYRRVHEAFADTAPASDLTTNRDILLTRRGNTLYVHANPPLKSEAILLPPLARLPRQATLLNTGASLACSTAVLPLYWQSNVPVLRIRLPLDASNGNVTLVLKLEFDHELTAETPPTRGAVKGALECM